MFQGTVPMRPQARTVLMRVLRVQKDTIQLKLTALPDSPPIASQRKRIWVKRTDLDTMLATGLAKVLTHLPCPSCGNKMTLYNGLISQPKRSPRKALMFACGQCEEQLEV